MSSPEKPPDQSSDETLRGRREVSDSASPPPADDTRTGIIRRHPTGPIPEPLADDTRTRIIRRHPIEPPPGEDAPTMVRRRSAETPSASDDDTPTAMVRRHPVDTPSDTEDAPTSIVRALPWLASRPAPQRIEGAPKAPSNVTAIAASTVSILSGWATAVVATDLITGWWQTDRLFCVGVGFLTGVFAASTIAGVVGLLLRRRAGIYLTVVAAVLGLLIFVGIFVTGAHAAGVVHAIPVLPVATIALAVAPATWRWAK